MAALNSMLVAASAAAHKPAAVLKLQVVEGCHDDPTYVDIYTCASWAGYSCRAGGWGIDSAERILHLVNSCPEYVPLLFHPLRTSCAHFYSARAQGMRGRLTNLPTAGHCDRLAATATSSTTTTATSSSSSWHARPRSR